MKGSIQRRIKLEQNIYKLQKGCWIINIIIVLHFFYALGQLVIVFIFLIKTSLYLDQIGALYLHFKGFQYLFDLVVTYKGRIGNQNFNFVLNRLEVSGASNQLLELFEQHEQKAHFIVSGYPCFIPYYNLYRFYNLVSLLFLIPGHIIFYYNLSDLPLWIFIVQFIIAWIRCLLPVLLFVVSFVANIFLGGVNYYYIRLYGYRRCSIKNNIPEQYSSVPQKQLQYCIICLIEYTNDDIIFQINCKGNHMFHLDCIEQWKQIRNNCPLCREEI